MVDVKSAAQAAAAQLTQQLGLASGGPAHPAPTKSLDEILARDRSRIAAAEQRNLNYVRDKQSAEKQRAKAAAAAAVAVMNAPKGGADVPGATDETAPPPAKAPRLAARSNTGAAAACSVYVSGLPLDVEATELEEHMQRMGPVVRVKLYRDAGGSLKGDALVTYQKDAAVIGAVQLLNGTMLRPGCVLAISRPIWGSADAAPADGDADPAAGSASANLTDKERENRIKDQLIAAAEAAAAVRAKGGIAAAPRLIPGLARVAQSAPTPIPSQPTPPAPPPPPPPPASGADTAAATASSSSSTVSDEALRVVLARRSGPKRLPWCRPVPPLAPAGTHSTQRRRLGKLLGAMWLCVDRCVASSCTPRCRPPRTLGGGASG